MSKRRQRSGFGWSAERHQTDAADRIMAASEWVANAVRAADQGFCLSALEALTSASEALGHAAHALNAAEIAPGMSTEFKQIYRAAISARKHIAQKCMR
jgi:hypothetical protein